MLVLGQWSKAQPYLLVESSDGSVLLCLSLAQSQQWQMLWRHSVSGIEVRDGYRWQYDAEDALAVTDSNVDSNVDSDVDRDAEVGHTSDTLDGLAAGDNAPDDNLAGDNPAVSMWLYESFTPRFDAGLGHSIGRGRLEASPAGYWIRDINERLPDAGFYLRVGSMAVDHRIVYASRSYSLSAEAAGERVRIRLDSTAPAQAQGKQGC